MNPGAWVAAWAELRSQWQINTRLRIGAWAILGILWVYALLLASDGILALRNGTQALASDIERLQPMTRSNPWPTRVDDARQQLDALRTMEWVEGEGGELGLTEAALQDWVRATAAKAGLRLREMTLSRGGAPPALSTSAGSGDTAATTQPRGQAVKVRMTADWDRGALVAFLAEVGRSERVVVAERLLLRPAATPPSAEIDLRVWARGAAVATAAGAPAGPSR